MRVSEEVLADACINGGHNVHGLTPNEKCDLALDLRDARAAIALAVAAMTMAEEPVNRDCDEGANAMLYSALAACRKETEK